MQTIAFISIFIGIAASLFITIDIIRHPQKMKVMNIVWPVTMLYSGLIGLWAYNRFGQSRAPFWQSVLKGALHCGSGCTLGDIVSSFLLLLMPVTIAGNKLAGDWLVEYIAAFTVGIVFQYYAIKPMKHLSAKAALIAALKADALSLTFWQIGMYGWMAISNFLIFHRLLKANEPVFWLMMQIGMFCGLATAFPVNWWLIKKGIKEAM